MAEWRPLRDLNPLTKLAVAVVYIIVVTILFDERIQAIVLAISIACLLALERIAPRRLLGVMLPFALMGGGFWWTHWMFESQAGGYVDSLGRHAVVRDGADAGLVVFLRAINFGTISFLFVVSTRPADLSSALIQRLRMPPAVAFSIGAAVQFIPALRADFAQLRLARRLRSRRARSWLAPMQSVSLLIPLLAAAIRRAQRSAISMEARGLARPMVRTALRGSTFALADAWFVAFASALLAAAVAVSLE